ncbi:MAG: DUF4250 domain-containing protein [Lachnospiraceae bacterium]|nr:DUF4250 domain-containing protein [Lachnospiraceae bacterium]
MIPRDPVMLLSFTNTQLRDHYNTLEEFCSAFDVDKQELIEKLQTIDYKYNPQNNQFI